MLVSTKSRMGKEDPGGVLCRKFSPLNCHQQESTFLYPYTDLRLARQIRPPELLTSDEHCKAPTFIATAGFNKHALLFRWKRCLPSEAKCCRGHCAGHPCLAMLHLA
ncbi:unnamed protein product [Urochloa humidicola]